MRSYWFQNRDRLDETMFLIASYWITHDARHFFVQRLYVCMFTICPDMISAAGDDKLYRTMRFEAPTSADNVATNFFRVGSCWQKGMTPFKAENYTLNLQKVCKKTRIVLVVHC